MRKTVLITGINGFLGSQLAKKFSEKYRVIGLEFKLDNLFRISNESYKIYSSDVEHSLIFKENEIYCIIHAATVYNRIGESIKDVLRTNIFLPINLFEEANNHGVKLFINTDSFFNNPSYNYSYLREYTLSKRHAIDWLQLLESSKCKLVNMIIFHMYGPFDSSSKFVTSIINKLKNNEKKIETTLGEQTRDFVFIDDVVDAYDFVLESIEFLPDSNMEFEVGLGKEIAIKDFIMTIKNITKSESRIDFGAIPYRDNEIMTSKADNLELINLGWTPKYSIDDGIRRILEVEL
ncbi:CDP-paratose synthase [Urechidicola sp. KH5]